ncbi:MAG: DegT/DnrJ/EryC1/StrS aminotransferase [Candidatus Pacebacteria bacterium CG2_30_36_39]|nr:MAG: DegT/DnrJ/EryC1/StrS aminotransferase [Candidatus Pacebacteria bacterium CG2_30_36_39]
MIKLIKSTFYNESVTKKELVEFIEKADILSFAKECSKFEKNFSKYQGRKECIMVNSGSSANLAIMQALLNLGYIKKNDKIAFSSLTWSTNTMPIIQLGLKAVPVDVELNTLNVSSKKLLKTLDKEKNIKMFFLTNLLGFSDDIDKISKICKQKKIILVEDNCESLGSVYKKKKLGNFGIASTFSFYVGHHMSTIEGGAICTDNKKLAEMLRLVRAHGWDRNLTNNQQKNIRKSFKINSSFYSRYTFYDLGYNLRPTEINGFLGNNQLKYIEEIIKKRNKNFTILASEIYKKTDKYYPIKWNHMDFLSNFAFPVICKTQEIRDELVKKCKGKVEIRPVVGGDITQQPFYKKYYSKLETKKNNAFLVHKQGLYFGNNPELTDKELRLLIDIFTTN